MALPRRLLFLFTIHSCANCRSLFITPPRLCRRGFRRFCRDCYGSCARRAGFGGRSGAGRGFGRFFRGCSGSQCVKIGRIVNINNTLYFHGNIIRPGSAFFTAASCRQSVWRAREYPRSCGYNLCGAGRACALPYVPASSNSPPAPGRIRTRRTSMGIGLLTHATSNLLILR